MNPKDGQDDIDASKLGYQCTKHVSTPDATHFVITKRK
jgi:hypothetical protein